MKHQKKVFQKENLTPFSSPNNNNPNTKQLIYSTPQKNLPESAKELSLRSVWSELSHSPPKENEKEIIWQQKPVSKRFEDQSERPNSERKRDLEKHKRLIVDEFDGQLSFSCIISNSFEDKNRRKNCQPIGDQAYVPYTLQELRQKIRKKFNSGGFLRKERKIILK